MYSKIVLDFFNYSCITNACFSVLFLKFVCSVCRVVYVFSACIVVHWEAHEQTTHLHKRHSVTYTLHVKHVHIFIYTHVHVHTQTNAFTHPLSIHINMQTYSHGPHIYIHIYMHTHMQISIHHKTHTNRHEESHIQTCVKTLTVDTHVHRCFIHVTRRLEQYHRSVNPYLVKNVYLHGAHLCTHELPQHLNLWTYTRADTQTKMCQLGVRPGLGGRRGSHTMTHRAQTCILEDPNTSNTTEVPREDAHKEHKEWNFKREQEQKARNSGLPPIPPFVSTFSGYAPPSPPSRVPPFWPPLLSWSLFLGLAPL